MAIRKKIHYGKAVPGKVDYWRAIERPFTDDKKLVIGTLLRVPILLVGLVTNTIVSGYSLYCGKTAYEGNYKMPDWENYWNLLLKGIIAQIVSLAYSIPAMISVFLFAPLLIQRFYGRIDFLSNVLNFIQNPIGLVGNYGTGIIAVWFLFMLAAYLAPIATLGYIIDDKPSSAFDFSSILRKAMTGRYFVAWLMLFLVGLIIGNIGNVVVDALRLLLGVAGLLAALIFLAVASLVGFAVDVFRYTVYGNVLAEMKK